MCDPLKTPTQVVCALNIHTDNNMMYTITKLYNQNRKQENLILTSN